MNDIQLTQHFLFACLKYAEDNGDVTNYGNFSPDVVGLEYDGKEYKIMRWEHPSPIPSLLQLQSYTIENLSATIERYQMYHSLAGSRVAINKSAKIDAKYSNTGDLSFKKM